MSSISNIILGLILIVVGLAWGRVSYRFLNRGVETTGVVEDIIKEFDSDNDEVYYPVFSFQNNTKDAFRIKSKHGSGILRLKIGQQVTVLYDPNNPQNAEIKTWSNLWAFPIIGCGVGLFLILSGAGLFGR